MFLCFSLISPIRVSKNRSSVLSYFDAHKIDVDIYGPETWLEFCSSFKYLHYKGQLSLDETIEKYQDYHFVINDNNDFTDGSHERVFNALLSGAIPITPRNSYYEELSDTAPIILYERNTMAGLPENGEELKEIYREQRNLLERSAPATRENHSWSARAKTILELVKLSSLGSSS